MNDLMRTIRLIGSVYDHKSWTRQCANECCEDITAYDFDFNGKSYFVEEGSVSYTYDDECGVAEETISVTVNLVEKADGVETELKLDGQEALDYFDTGQWAEWIREWWHT